MEPPIEFEIVSSGDDYTDFINSYLQVKVKINPLMELHWWQQILLDLSITFFSLFSQVDVSLNGTQISNSTNTYPYRAYLENLLTYGPSAKDTQLTVALFYKDQAGKMIKCNPLEAATADRNSGLVKRHAFISENKELDMMGRIHWDIFFQPRYMLNEVNTKIKLTRSKDVFSLCGTGNQAFKVLITSAAMHIRKVKVSSSVYLAHPYIGEWYGKVSY